ncbi:MAG: hypothetical protein LBP52_09260 [Burkholderiaceae bacterium]|nr:hypothetical protein [Burkholderiaceae bacterium]
MKTSSVKDDERQAFSHIFGHLLRLTRQKTTRKTVRQNETIFLTRIAAGCIHAAGGAAPVLRAAPAVF